MPTPVKPFLELVEVVSFDISINNSPLKDNFQVLSIEVERHLNKVATAKLSIMLPFGSGDNEAFDLTKDEHFYPGNPIQIAAGDENSKKVIFKGLIVQTGIRNLQGQYNEWQIQCSDESVKMSLGCRSKSYANMKDSAVISAIAGEYGLSPTVDATQITHKQLVQYQSNDWDFILERAEANGLVVYTEDNKLMAKKPLASGEATLLIDYESDTIAYDMNVDARNQLVSTNCSSWDTTKLATVKGSSQEPSLSAQGKLKGKDLGQKFHPTAAEYSSLALMDQSELKEWANGLLLKSRLSRLQGSVTFYGNATPKLNTIVTLSGFGVHFNGDALVTGIRHEIKKGFWKTTVFFGLPPASYHEQRNSSAAQAGGLLPAIQGLQNAVVKKISDDPDGLYRVQVDAPTLLGDTDGIWARLIQFYGTSGKGSFFYPEVGDEVLLGFINGDPRFPVILGTLYGGKNKPPYTPDQDNKIKAIVTKNDLKLEMDDKDKVITISTPGGNQIILSDKDSSILIKDKSGNKVEMNSSGIKLDSFKDIVINAGKGKITLSALQDISVSSSAGNVSISGLNVDAKANIAFSAQGNASAELKSAASTAVKGAIVMIN